jgi:hypothetical protein
MVISVKKLSFALYDTQGYMNALWEYFNSKSFLVESRLFTREESLESYLENHCPDVLLLGQEVSKHKIHHLNHAENIVILCEGDMVAENDEQYPLIFKYQSASGILQEIFRIVGESGKEALSSMAGLGEHTEFLGIYHPYGEPLSVQRIFSVKGGREKKSLLVDMELLSGLESGKEEVERIRGMSEMVFYLKQKSEKLAAKLRALVRGWEGIDCLYPVEDYRDLYSLNRDDMDRLLSVLANETDYERVVFDVGFLNDSALYLLYCCDQIYIPRARNSWEENQKIAMERLFVREGLEEMVESIQYVSAC